MSRFGLLSLLIFLCSGIGWSSGCNSAYEGLQNDDVTLLDKSVQKFREMVEPLVARSESEDIVGRALNSDSDGLGHPNPKKMEEHGFRIFGQDPYARGVEPYGFFSFLRRNRAPRYHKHGLLFSIINRPLICSSVKAILRTIIEFILFFT